MGTNENLLNDQWVKSLPNYIREALDVIDDSLNDFSGNVRMAETLAKLAFRRAVSAIVEETEPKQDYVELEDYEANGEELDLKDRELIVAARIDQAIRANKEAAKMKEQRVRMIDEFTEVTDMPKPANLTFTVLEPTKRDKIEKLKYLGFYKEAAAIEEELAYEDDEADYE